MENYAHYIRSMAGMWLTYSHLKRKNVRTLPFLYYNYVQINIDTLVMQQSYVGYENTNKNPKNRTTFPAFKYVHRYRTNL